MIFKLSFNQSFYFFIATTVFLTFSDLYTSNWQNIYLLPSTQRHWPSAATLRLPPVRLYESCHWCRQERFTCRHSKQVFLLHIFNKKCSNLLIYFNLMFELLWQTKSCWFVDFIFFENLFFFQHFIFSILPILIERRISSQVILIRTIV